MTTFWGEKGLRIDEAFMLAFTFVYFFNTANKFCTQAIEAAYIMMNGGF